MRKMIGIKIRTVAFAVLLAISVGKLGSYTFSKSVDANFLVVGVDDASENTDVISVVRVDTNGGKASFLQIPRDTYCSLDIYQQKINHIFSVARAEGANREEAVLRLREFLSGALSVRIDGHILIDSKSFLNLVSAIGGIDVKVDNELTLYDGSKPVLTLLKGENHLDPESAMILVRHRAGYLRGDIERLEMQRIFVSGLFNTLLNKVGLSDMMRVASALKECETDIPVKSLISIFSNRKAFAGSAPIGTILPGEAIKGKNGVWYYVLNRRMCDELLVGSFEIKSGLFDKDKHFLNESDDDFKNIYYR